MNPITTVMERDEFLAPGVIGWTLDIARVVVAAPAAYLTVFVAPAVLGPAAGAVVATVATVAAVLVAVPGVLRHAGLPAQWLGAARTAAWSTALVLTLAMLAISVQSGTTVGLQFVGGAAAIAAVYIPVYRFVAWADLRTDTALPVSRRWQRRQGSEAK